VHLTVCPALSSDHLLILIYTTCGTFFQKILDHPRFTRMDWLACLEDRLLENSVVNDDEIIDKCMDEMTSAIQQALVASATKRLPRSNPRTPLPTSIQDETRQKRQWRNPALKAHVNRFQRLLSCRLNERRNDQWSNALESLDSEDQSLRKMTERMMRLSTPSPPCLCRKN
jgi:hypothetical protein